MPRYIDFHSKMPTPAKTDIEGLRSSLGEPDEFGVKTVDAVFTKDSQAYCITEGPNAEAVCKSHEAHGMKLGRGDVHEVASELRT